MVELEEESPEVSLPPEEVSFEPSSAEVVVASPEVVVLSVEVVELSPVESVVFAVSLDVSVEVPSVVVSEEPVVSDPSVASVEAADESARTVALNLSANGFSSCYPYIESRFVALN